MTGILEAKRLARAQALEARVAHHAAAPGAGRMAAGHALQAIAALRGVGVVSGYLPTRHELDPLPAMMTLVGLGFRVVVPVVTGRGEPLTFRTWRPGVATVRGAFGVSVPVEGETLEPDVLLVPMLAFDRRGHRLGYGGGFYDRTIAALRARRLVTALGLAFADQELARVPDSDNDMRLDAIATERGMIWPG